MEFTLLITWFNPFSWLISRMMKKPRKSRMGIIKIALLIPAILITLGLTTGMTPQQKPIKGKVVFADTGEPATGAKGSLIKRS